MTSLADLRPGDIGFGPIKGGAGLLVNAGQLLLGEGFHVGKLDIRHVFVVTEAASEPRRAEVLPNGDLLRAGGDMYRIPPFGVEAMPRGARTYTLRSRWTPEYAYVRLPEDYPGQAEDAAAVARAMIGTPYSFASYVALAAWRFGLKAERLERWINRRRPPVEPGANGVPVWGPEVVSRKIELPCEAICSVLADQAWSLTGKRIMEGVAHQCVTPGALAGRLLSYPGAVWSWPR
jgi:hypothetical protein